MNDINGYYNRKEVLNEIFSSVEKPDCRVWTIQDINGSFRTSDKRINSIKKLRDFLLNIKFMENDKGEMDYISKSTPSKVYVSIAQFLNPTKIYGKRIKRGGYVIADSLFLKSDLLFDIDADNLETAHSEAKRIIEHMKSESYELINICFSGRRGFHLLYKDKEPIIEENPIKRYEKAQKRREELIERLPKLKTIDGHHKRIIADQFRVHSAIGTIKAETGQKVTKIDERVFMLSSTEELKKLTAIRVVRAIKDYPPFQPPFKSPMMGSTPLHKQSNEEGTTLTSSLYTYKFIDNVVRGIKSKTFDDVRYITVLKFPINRKVNIGKIQRVYDLDAFYMFVYNNIKMDINLKLVDKRRLEKIMKYSKAMNLNSFMFYGHTWIPISEARDSNGYIVWEKPVLKEIIGSIYGVNDTHSLPHANLLNIKFNNMAGKEENRICRAMVGEWHTQ